MATHLPTIDAESALGGGCGGVPRGSAQERRRDMRKRLPEWFKTTLPTGTAQIRYNDTKSNVHEHGLHTVCAQMTDEFLAYSVSAGNDLVTPMPQYGFPGLKEGDRWCLCAMRWHQAHEAGEAPRLYLRATHQKTLEIVPLNVLKQFALDLS